MSRPIPSATLLRYLHRNLQQQANCRSVASTFNNASHLLPHKLTSSSITCKRAFGSTKTLRDQSDEENLASQRRRLVYVKPESIDKEFVLDENISSRRVQLKSPDGGLTDPVALNSLLKDIDRQKEVIHCLQSFNDRPAVVEVIKKEDLLDRLRLKETKKLEQQKSQRSLKPKQVELNWAISANDLDLKLKQLRQFVDKGKRVELLLAAKKRQRKASPEEAEHVLAEIRKVISEIEGCRELYPMEGKIGGQVLMVVGKK